MAKRAPGRHSAAACTAPACTDFRVVQHAPAATPPPASPAAHLGKCRRRSRCQSYGPTCRRRVCVSAQRACKTREHAPVLVADAQLGGSHGAGSVSRHARGVAGRGQPQVGRARRPAQQGYCGTAKRRRSRSAALEATQGRGRRAWALVTRGNSPGADAATTALPRKQRVCKTKRQACTRAVA